MNIIIRQEEKKDYLETEKLVQLAFSGAEYADGDEADLVANLRLEADFIPQLSLVAVMEDEIIGHIMFSKVTVGNTDTSAVTLAPLTVLPKYQGQGVGSRLTLAGHEKAKKLGYVYSIVLGHSEYYPRFGYTTASGFGITSPSPVPDEAFMALKLLESAPDTLGGEVEYQMPFHPVE